MYYSNQKISSVNVKELAKKYEENLKKSGSEKNSKPSPKGNRQSVKEMANKIENRESKPASSESVSQTQVEPPQQSPPVSINTQSEATTTSASSNPIQSNPPAPVSKKAIDTTYMVYQTYLVHSVTIN